MPLGIPTLRVKDIFINARSFVDHALALYVDPDTVPNWFVFEDWDASAPGGVYDIEIIDEQIIFHKEGVYSAAIDCYMSKAGVNPETIWLIIEFSTDGGSTWLKYPYSRHTGMDVAGAAALASGRFEVQKGMRFRLGAVSTDGITTQADLTSFTGISFTSCAINMQKVADLS